MKRHLEITSKRTAQEIILLEQLPYWTISQLEDKLESLRSKGIISLSNSNSTKRKISLEIISTEKLKEIELLFDYREKELLQLLKKYISK